MKAYPELKIALASDHGGWPLKQEVIRFLKEQGASIHDFGCDSDQSCDYPDFAHLLGYAVARGEYDFGIVICSTGNGITMTANKHTGIRAALCWEPELARLARAHNNANVLGLPGKFVSVETGLEIVKSFFSTDFEGGRHERRVGKIEL